MAAGVNPAGELSISGSTGFAQIAELLRAVTVHVSVSTGRYGRGFGSGVVWSANGLVITNAHVAQGASALVEFQNGRRFPASVIGRDANHDLAGLQIRGAVFSPPLVRDSATLRVGELVIAMGNPLGEIGAVSAGMVHSAGNGDYLEADIRLAPGNSGGPLADSEGRIVGINTCIANGMGVAIGTRRIIPFVAQLMSSRN
jgi:serine protease Do